MAKQVLYTANDIDQILPRDEQERRVLAAAVKHGLLTPMAWDSPPTHFGRNPATFAELCAFAADVSGVLVERPHGVMAVDPVQAERERCAAIADDEARIRTEAGQQHSEDSEARGRCFAAARAAMNVAKGIRSGEVVAGVEGRKP